MESAALSKPSDIQTLPSNVCVKGHLNVDGDCVEGGYLMAKSLNGPNLPEFGPQHAVGCTANPVYYLPYVPYETNHISGHNFDAMRTIAYQTKLRQSYPP